MKTTLAGLLGAALVVIQQRLQEGRDLTDWKTWLPAVAVAIVGFLAKDSSKKGA